MSKVYWAIKGKDEKLVKFGRKKEGERIMANLDGVKVGDRLWMRSDVYEGWAEIREIVNTSYPIILVNGFQLTMDGVRCYGGPQVLFWDKVEIVPPPRPKRLVKKVVEGWVNMYPGNGLPLRVHRTKQLADENACSDRIACVYVTDEYEIEE